MDNSRDPMHFRIISAFLHFLKNLFFEIPIIYVNCLNITVLNSINFKIVKELVRVALCLVYSFSKYTVIVWYLRTSWKFVISIMLQFWTPVGNKSSWHLWRSTLCHTPYSSLDQTLKGHVIFTILHKINFRPRSLNRVKQPISDKMRI